MAWPRKSGRDVATLFLRLSGPLQAWGTTSRFDERDTQLEPSKSGVLGLVCAALGRDRAEPVDDLAALRMGVRADREGLVMRDYQTATGAMTAGGRPDADRTVVSPRYYLADAAFLVGLEGADRTLLQTIQTALRTPRWPLSLGRRAMVPSVPAWLPDGLREGDLAIEIRRYPRIAPARDEHRGEPTRVLIEHPTQGALRLDQPIAPYSERRFGPRFVLSGVVEDVPQPATPESR